MKNLQRIYGVSLAGMILIIVSAFTIHSSWGEKTEAKTELPKEQKQMVNLFVTHGHCSTPFGGVVSDLSVTAAERYDLGNPLEGMQISFSIDPNTFNVCRAEELTAKIKTPGLFISEDNEMISFYSTDVYTMGIDWYQVNGKMSIKGVERDVKLFVSGIRNSQDSKTTTLVLQGQVNLFDWGIDYDKIVNGQSRNIVANPSKWMYINMRIDLV